MTYIEFHNKKDVRNLDLNVWHYPVDNDYPGVNLSGSSGRFLYKNEPRHQPYYLCDPGRDIEINYIIGTERERHPDHSSRFGYNKAWNGYGSGHWPGRYLESELCSVYDPQPQEMAPTRFYGEKYQGPYVANSENRMEIERHIKSLR